MFILLYIHIFLTLCKYLFLIKKLFCGYLWISLPVVFCDFLKDPLKKLSMGEFLLYR